MTNEFDVILAAIGASQAALLGFLTYKSSQRGKQTNAMQESLDVGISTDVSVTKRMVESLSDEIFHSRVAHGILENKVDEVHAQVHQIRGELAMIGERIESSGDIKTQ